MKCVHSANFGDKPLGPLQLLKQITTTGLDEIFYNICVALRMFCTLPVSAERSFSKPRQIKNDMRSTTTEGRLDSLAMLSIESELSRQTDFGMIIIDEFTKRENTKSWLRSICTDVISSICSFICVLTCRVYLCKNGEKNIQC